MDKTKDLDNTKVILFFCLVVASALLVDFGFAATAFNKTTMTVFITNTAPTLNSADVQPDPAIPGQTLEVSADISDANGDTVTANYVVYEPDGSAASGSIGLPNIGGTSYYDNNYTLSTSAPPGTWYVNITYGDGIATVVYQTTFTVNSVTSTTLKNTPIDFGNQTVGQTDQRAENGTYVEGVYSGIIAGFPLIINNTGNVLSNYSINGTDLVGVSDEEKIIGVGNVSWATTIGGSKTDLAKGAPTTFASDVAAGSSQDIYFWIDTPYGVTQQRYNGVVTIATTG